ncbi:alpha/beta hydrolase [Bacillus sp. FJAT-49736]|nr:alpha/beta hydrolase [Bacillus sp. FJAT-49736]MBS4175122.1 alpha/beta hydrolase [Bacillus sp. FJAT-49736]
MIVSMKETGHLVHWDKPEEVADAINKWATRFIC